MFERDFCGGPPVDDRRARLEMIESDHPTLPISRQCALVGIGRSTCYGGPRVERPENLALVRAIDEQLWRRRGTGPDRWRDILDVPVMSWAASVSDG